MWRRESTIRTHASDTDTKIQCGMKHTVHVLHILPNNRKEKKLIAWHYNCDCMFLNYGIILKITLSAFFECKIFLMILYHASTASQTSKKRFCLRLSPYVGYFFHRANVTERNMNHLPISRSIIILHQIYNTKNINSESSFVSMQYTSSCWYYWQFVRCITHTQVHYSFHSIRTIILHETCI